MGGQEGILDSEHLMVLQLCVYFVSIHIFELIFPGEERSDKNISL